MGIAICLATLEHVGGLEHFRGLEHLRVLLTGQEWGSNQQAPECRYGGECWAGGLFPPVRLAVLGQFVLGRWHASCLVLWFFASNGSEKRRRMIWGFLCVNNEADVAHLTTLRIHPIPPYLTRTHLGLTEELWVDATHLAFHLHRLQLGATFLRHQHPAWLSKVLQVLTSAARSRRKK